MKVNDLNRNWLNHALRNHRGHSVISHYVVTDIGAGIGFGGKVLRLDITYDQPNHGPTSVVLKVPVEDPEMLKAVKAQGFHKEAMFYQKFASQLNGLPQIYHVEISDDGFAILMQDLGKIDPASIQRNATIQKRSSHKDTQACIQAIAKIHARYWNNPPDDTWLTSFTDGDANQRFDTQSRIQRAIERLKEAQPTQGQAAQTQQFQYLLNCAHRLALLIVKAPGKLDPPNPITLIHGDFHANNLLVSDDGVTIFDWQLVGSGAPMMDVANFIASSVSLEDNEIMTPKLLENYFDAIRRCGIEDFSMPALNKAYGDARFFTFLKFLIIFGTINYDDNDATLKSDAIRKLVFLAKQANALSYCRKLSILFFLSKLINRLPFNKPDKP